MRPTSGWEGLEREYVSSFSMSESSVRKEGGVVLQDFPCPITSVQRRSVIGQGKGAELRVPETSRKRRKMVADVIPQWRLPATSSCGIIVRLDQLG